MIHLISDFSTVHFYIAIFVLLALIALVACSALYIVHDARVRIIRAEHRLERLELYLVASEKVNMELLNEAMGLYNRIYNVEEGLGHAVKADRACT